MDTTPRRSTFPLALGTILLFAVVAGPLAAQAPPGASCNQTAIEPIAFVSTPGNPFTPLASQDGCWIFVTMPTGSPGGVAVFHRAGGKVSFVRAVRLDGANGATLTHDGKLLIVTAGGSVTFFDVQQLTSGGQRPVLTSVSDGSSAGSIYVIVTADDQFAFVSDERGQSVTVISLATSGTPAQLKPKIIGKIPVGDAPVGLALSPDGRYLYSTSEVAPPKLQWPNICTPEGSPATNTNGRVAARGRGARAQTGGIEPASSRHPEGALIVADIAVAERNPDRAVIATVRARCNPVRVALSPAGDIVYVTARHDDALLVFDAAKLLTDGANSLKSTTHVGTAPVGLFVVDSGRKIIVTNSNRFGGGTDQQTLSIVDAAKALSGGDAVIGSIPAGAFPRELRMTADERTLLLTNFTSGTLELIDLARLPVKGSG